MKEFIKKNCKILIYISAILLITIIGTIMNFKNQSKFFIISNYLITLIIMIVLYKEIDNVNKIKKDKKDRTILFWIMIFISWIPCFLAYYPVLFNYDILDQFTQISTGQYSSYHPILHTLLCKLFYDLGNMINNIEISFALYTIFQMLMLSFSMSYSLNIMYKKGCKVWLVCLWYMFFPANAVMSLCMTKDIIFSALFLLVFSYLIEYKDIEVDKNKIVFWAVRFVIVSVLMMLFRKNAIFAFLIITIGFTLYNLFNKTLKNNTALIVLLVTSLILFSLTNTIIKIVLDAEDGDKREMLSVPIQQIARVYCKYNQNIDEEDKQYVLSIIAEKDIMQYREDIADDVKDKVVTNNILDSKFKFANIYIKLGIKYPLEYIKAFLFLNKGYWDLADTTYMHIYDQFENRQGYLLTDMKENDFIKVEHVSKLPFVEKIYELIATDNIHEKIPVISAMLAPSFYIFLFSVTLLVNKSDKERIPYMFFWSYFITVILGPCAIMRYAYPLMISAPIGIMNLLIKGAIEA